MGQSIGVVDDEPVIRRALASALHERGYEVREFRTLQQARTALATRPVDLLIVDVLLPDGVGHELLGSVHDSSRRPVPTILISGFGTEEDVVGALSAGAVDYLMKPFRLEQLLARVRVHLARPSPASGRLAPARPDGGLAEGLTFGRYSVLREIGRGGYGVVYLAEAPGPEGRERVALKIPEPLEVDPQAHARFARETHALASVRERHVVGIREMGFVGDRPFCAMEYVEGESLHAHVRREGPLSELEVRPLLLGLLSALAAIETVGLLHRDLKPANVLLRHGVVSEPVIIDFGLARWEFERGLTAPDSILGTVQYLPPETIREGRYDHRSDLYALGLTIRFALVGEDAFSGLQGFELLQAMADGAIAPPSVELSPGFRALLGRLCDPCSERRPASAVEALGTLRAALREMPSEARAPRPPGELRNAKTVRYEGVEVPGRDSGPALSADRGPG